MPELAEKPSDIALAFVGSVVPDEPQFWTAAFNRAGNSFQAQLLRGLADGSIPDIEVLSVRPIPSYPKSRKIWFPSARGRLEGGIAIRFLPFPNVTPVKQISLGFGVVFSVLAWAWRKRHRKRVVLTYNLSVPPAAFTLVAAKLARAKSVVSVNDVNVPGETVPATLRFRLDFALQRLLMPRFDGYSVVADRIADDFFPGRRYVRVEGGVDRQFLERTERRIDRTDQRSTVLVFAGTLNAVNGVLVILEAFREVPNPDLRLKIAGTGPLEDAVKEAVRTDPRVEYLGVLDAAGLSELYTEADVLLNVRLTATVDTRYFFPSKLIEYLASGVPTITTRVAHSQDEFGEIAYILSDESPEALASLLVSVTSLDPDERRSMGRRARQYVASRKTWEVQSRKVSDYIRGLVDDSSQRKAALSGDPGGGD